MPVLTTRYWCQWEALDDGRLVARRDVFDTELAAERHATHLVAGGVARVVVFADDDPPPAPVTRSGADAARAALRGAERATATEGERDA